MFKIVNLRNFVFSVLFCELAGLIGAFFTHPALAGWYRTLVLPKIAVPDFVFTPVDIILYLLMGISLYLIWQKGIHTEDEKIAVLLFITQIVLYVVWAIFFFRFKELFTGLIDLLGLFVAIILNIIYFYRISKTAAFLLFPYLIWVCYLIVLNYAIYQLNS